MRFAMQASVAEESERNLKEIKKHIEEKAKEATENKDSATGKDAVAPDSPLDQKSPAVPVASAPATETTPAKVPQASLPAAQVNPHRWPLLLG